MWVITLAEIKLYKQLLIDFVHRAFSSFQESQCQENQGGPTTHSAFWEPPKLIFNALANVVTLKIGHREKNLTNNILANKCLLCLKNAEIWKSYEGVCKKNILLQKTKIQIFLFVFF